MLDVTRQMRARRGWRYAREGREDQIRYLYVSEVDRGPVALPTPGQPSSLRTLRAGPRGGGESPSRRLGDMDAGGWSARRLTDEEAVDLLMRAHEGCRASRDTVILSDSSLALPPASSSSHPIPMDEKFASAQAAVVNAVQCWDPEKAADGIRSLMMQATPSTRPGLVEGVDQPLPLFASRGNYRPVAHAAVASVEMVSIEVTSAMYMPLK